MKIIFSCGSKSWGGLEMQTVLLAKAMLNRGHEILLLVNENTTLSEKCLQEKIPHHTIAWNDVNTLSNIFKVRKIIRKFKPDIIHTQLSHDLNVLSPAKSVYPQTHLILTRRMASKVNKKDFLHRYLYNKVDLVLCISEFIKQNVLKTMPVDEKKTIIHYNGINLKKYQPNLNYKKEIRQKLQITENELVIGFLGRFTPMKGHQVYFEAGKILIEKFPNLNLKFLVAGGDSFGEESFGNHCRELGKKILGEQVIFTGNIENSAEILAAMDIFVFPSHEESFGNVLCEAGAMELASVASNNGGVPDIVIDKKTGILVPPKNAFAFAEAIAQYATNPNLRIEHGKNARLNILKKFEEEKQIQKLEKIYKWEWV